MKSFIKKRLREQMIDGQNMNSGTQKACNTMSVTTYKEGLNLIINAIGTPQENPEMWKRIARPLKNWQEADLMIGQEVKEKGMSGDSMPDESNTWWAAIQSTICELGEDGLNEITTPNLIDVDTEFDKIKNSCFRTLKPLTINQMFKNWSEIKNIKNDNIDTIKFFISQIQNGKKIDCLTFDDKGLADGYHRLIAAKICGVKSLCHNFDKDFD